MNEGTKKLKIGYLLTGLADNEQVLPRWQLLQMYNKKRFEVFVYINDRSVERYAGDFSQVVLYDITEMNADMVAQAIRRDRVDILVELSGVKCQKFLEIFRRKPAKTQVCFAGEYNSTGLKAVHYLFTEKYLDPLNQKADYYEQLFYLPQVHFCYVPLKEKSLLKKAPFKENRYVTFAGLYHFTELCDDFLLLWRDILKALPNSRLLLKSRIFGSGYGCQETKFRLNRLGFPCERVAFVAGNTEDVSLYSQIDIVLGTYPYQNGQKICELLHHGIPVVTLTGNRHCTRMGYSILKNVGLEECLAFTEQAYVKRAVALAGNPYKLANLRRSLPERMEKSPLMDARRFVGNIERAYEAMWKALQAQRKAEGLKKEISKLLLTVLEGMSYIAENVAGDAKDALVLQMVDDMIIALENIEMVVLGSPILRAYAQESHDLLDLAKRMRKLYRMGDAAAARKLAAGRMRHAAEAFLAKLQ